jgi:hypothetical protein
MGVVATPVASAVVDSATLSPAVAEIDEASDDASAVGSSRVGVVVTTGKSSLDVVVVGAAELAESVEESKSCCDELLELRLFFC